MMRIKTRKQFMDAFWYRLCLSQKNGDMMLFTSRLIRIMSPYFDAVVIQDGRAVDSVEVTSLTANKRAQALKEDNIRNNGGVYVRDRVTKKLLDVSTAPTRTVRKP